MKVLVTGANSRLGSFLGNAWALREDMELVLSDRAPAAPGLAGREFRQVDLLMPEAIPELVQDMDRVVHLEALEPALMGAADPDAWLYRSLCGLYNLIQGAHAAGVNRFVLASSLSFFDRLPQNWQVNEVWRPRPTPELLDLLPWLAELSVREAVRATSLVAVGLRFGRLVDDGEWEGRPFDPRWVHMRDAAHAVDRSLSFEAGALRNATRPDWHVFHVSAPGPHAKIRLAHATGQEERAISAAPPFAYAPQHAFPPTAGPAAWTAPRDRDDWRQSIVQGAPVASRAIRKVVIFGAGGPMGTATAQAMQHDYQLRLCDLRRVEDIQAGLADAGPGRPAPRRLAAPHEHRIVDMRDARQVMDACAGMDAVINCSVLRPRLHEAFHVNMAGACSVARGAVAHGIRRVVQTGPFQQMDPGYGSYVWDFDIPVAAPARPLDYLYHHTKFLGQEALRVFAEYHQLEVAVMLFWRLVAPEGRPQIPPFAVSWADSGRALRRAVEAPSLPTCYEEFNVSADMPHRKFDHAKLRDVLGFVVRDDISGCWRDAGAGAERA